MLKKHFLIAIASLILTACGTAQPAPTGTPTQTFTPLPTSTPIPTPTLEPWLQSLPENVISVEVDGEQIFGLDSQGNRVMVYSLETGEWVETAPAVSDVDLGWLVDEDNIQIVDILSDTVKLTDEGGEMAVQFVTDISLVMTSEYGQFGVRNIDLPDLGMKSLAKKSVYKAYLEHGRHGGEPLSEVDFWRTTVAVQEGRGRPDSIVIDIPDDGTGTKKSVVFFAGDVELPIGVQGVGLRIYHLDGRNLRVVEHLSHLGGGNSTFSGGLFVAGGAVHIVWGAEYGLGYTFTNEKAFHDTLAENLAKIPDFMGRYNGERNIGTDGLFYNSSFFRSLNADEELYNTLENLSLDWN